MNDVHRGGGSDGAADRSDKVTGRTMVDVASVEEAARSVAGKVAVDSTVGGGGEGTGIRNQQHFGTGLVMLPLRTKWCGWPRDVATDEAAEVEGWLLACRSRALTD